MNKIWAITMVKDEEDIVYNSLLNMVSEGVHGIIAADNLSTDKSKSELLRLQADVRHKCQIVIIDDPEIGYWQSTKMTNLAILAKNDYGADWIIPFDCDELWYAPAGRFPEVIDSLPDYVRVINVPIINHFRTALDPETGNPFADMKWRHTDINPLPKVAIKWTNDLAIAQGNHSVISESELITCTDTIYIRHFPYRSWDHFYKKAKNGAAAYAATNLPISAGQHWRNYWQLIESQGADKVRAEVWEKYFWFFSPLDNKLILDPAPFNRWH